MSNFGADMVAIASGEVGYVEGPNNDNKYGAYFGMNNQPWCAFFLLWCMAQLGVDGFSYGFNGGVPSFYVQDNTDVNNLEPGDFVCFGQNASWWTSTQQHVELFVSYAGTGYINTIGGNTGGGSQSEGDGVYAKVRGLDQVTACIHFDPGNSIEEIIAMFIRLKRRREEDEL